MGCIKSLTKFAVLAMLTAGLGLGACSGDDEEAPYVERAPETIYDEAASALESGEYPQAVSLFDEVERQHPYSIWARRAILMGAFAAYEDNQYAKTIASSERFLQLYPGNEDAPYALYLIGQSYYEQISDVGRDPEMTRLALKSFTELARRYPDSNYAREAQLKVDLTQDHLAGKEMDVGRYYLDRGAYVGAINRFRNVIENFQTTSHVPEALHRIVEANLAQGLVSEAQTAAAVLGHNFPGSDWYADSFYLLEGVDLRPEVDQKSWLARYFDSFF